LPIRDITSDFLLASASEHLAEHCATFCVRASASDITPFGVDRMETPSPLLTRGMFFTEA
jgi:hypothetical protein